MDILDELKQKMLGATTPSWANRAADEIKALRSQVETIKSSHCSALARLDKLQKRKFARFNNEDCWIYQGDGQDNLESLVCPVVISAVDLMGLIGQNPAVMLQRQDRFGTWFIVDKDHVAHYVEKGQAIRELCVRKINGENDG